jgi:hypothetical protein
MPCISNVAVCRSGGGDVDARGEESETINAGEIVILLR